MQWAPNHILAGTGRTHTHTRTRTHSTHTRTQFIGGMKKIAPHEKKMLQFGSKTEYSANCLVIYKFVSLRHYHCFWHLCKRQGECVHIKMFTLNGRPPIIMAVWVEPIFKYLLTDSSAHCISSLPQEGSPSELELYFSSASNKRNGMASTFLCFQASTQKPRCSSYMWQVPMLPKWESFFGHLVLLKDKWVSFLRYPYNTILATTWTAKSHTGNSTLEA